ncbi:hypothetical protein ACFO4N_00155 [Camelliibacillus cellulosilyticus]|uniref:YtxH-like protein n=1 Tax=Camelliibacillus cellulosilyticus TaxID=2174486 RepID=A0ABV9GJ51_9BACL
MQQQQNQWAERILPIVAAVGAGAAAYCSLTRNQSGDGNMDNILEQMTNAQNKSSKSSS